VLAEIGCGTGGNLKFLQHHYAVMGVDTSAEAVAYCAGRVTCPVFHGDFRQGLASRWGEIDGVVLMDVLEHIDADGAFLQDIVAALKPRGVVLITVPAHRFLWTRHDEVLGHVRRYSARELRRLWSELPVVERFFSPFNCFLFPAITLARKLVALCGKGGGGESDLQPCHPLLNRTLRAVFSAERHWLTLCPLPFGVSYLAVLEKDGPGR
jgi:SAM-dependent methyltransferase